MKKGWFMIGIAALTSVSLVGCSSGTSKNSETENITFINNRTDLEANGKWDDYVTKFNKKYPNIKVEVQTMGDYAGQMKTRMNSDEYGDVLMIPTDISQKDLGNFLEPLGKTADLSKKYLGMNDRSYKGTSYGIPSQMDATGVVINKKVFKEAGISEFPKTPEDFINALKTIKEKNSDVTPLYTNYASGWALSAWDAVRTGGSGNANFTNEMTSDLSPFDAGDTMYEIYNTLYSAAKKGLIESDPTTSEWEQSKVDLANGKIAAMVIGSWAVQQVQEANEDNADNISFVAFPMTASDGKQYVGVGGNYNYGINVHSKHKKAARKFIDWMVNESGIDVANGALPTVKGADYPKTLQSLKDSGVELIEESPAPEGKETLFSDINNESELGIGSTETQKQRIIDAGVGNSKESFDDIMKDFNVKWAKAIKAVSDN